MTVLGKSMVAALLLCATTGYSQTLFTYGGKTVSKEEFLKAFSKNNTEDKPNEKSYRDYLNLYVNFKLKVQAARDMKMDTLQNQQAELSGFRTQVVETYMKDDNSVNTLVNEAFERSLKDVRIAHILVVPKNNTPEEEKKAQSKINAAYDLLKKGQDFGKVAQQYSEDSSAKVNQGDIGYITTFILPYQLESVAYTTPVGKFSAPFRSPAGYHIFKKVAERKAVGKIKIAQILLAFPPAATAAEKQKVKNLADSIYTLLQKNADFKELASQYSADNFSYQLGGEMMEFGIGRYDPVFETAAYSLAKDGDISKPILTSYGYHIIKRLQRIAITEDINNVALKNELTQEVQQSDRMDVSKKLFVKKILHQTGFTKSDVNEKSLAIFTDSVLQAKKVPELAGIKPATPLFSFTKRTVAVHDWQAYLETIRNYSNLRAGKTHAQLMEEFIENSALDYYRDHLEEYNNDFSFQLNEFREGNLLFEVMQRTIWDVAAQDSIGLKKYYDEHKNNYWWEASADAIIFTASNEQTADSIKNKVQADYKKWQQYVDGSSGTLLADSGRFELGQIPVLERTNFTPGLITASVKNETDNSITFAYIIKVYTNREPRSFADARGFVINDYQGYLEEKWIDDLKKKYPVQVNETVLASLAK